MIRTNRTAFRAFMRSTAGHLDLLRIGVLAAVLALPVAARAEPVTLNLKDADIGAVIATVSDITGKNFIVDPRVKGKITIVSSRPMDKDEVYQIFLSVLDVYGFSAVPAGKVTKIIPDANAKQVAIPTTDEEAPGRGDEFVTRVIELRNVSAAQLVPILRPLVPQQGHLAAYVPSNMLIVADRASNINRLVNLINRIDLPSSDEIEIVPLEHASAAEIVRILTALAQQDKARGGGAPTDPDASPVLIADERTNSVLIGGGKSGRLRLRALISHLDTPLQTQGNTRVIYLRYAQAKDLVPVLTGVSTSVEQQSKAAAGGQAAATSANNLPINIQADESSNSLVITAPPDVFNALEGVIKQLDIRRAQVMVEGIIAEVTTDISNQLGVQWVADGTPGGNGPVGLTNFSNAGSSISTIAGAVAAQDYSALSLSGLALGIGRFNSDDVNFAAIVQALKSDGSTNILSTPSLVTLDNEEAEIVVGQEVPFVTGSFTSTGTGSGSVSNPFQTISRENVGITLKVKPQINEGDAIKLDIEQTIDSLGAKGNAVDLVTNKRSIKTSLIVDDRQVVVLGGLIQDNVQQSVQKVPLLGDIPLLGLLFKSKSTTKGKTNLMVFLQTTILRDDVLMNRLTGSKYNYIRDIQRDTRKKGLLMMSNDEAPIMPPLDDLLALPPPVGGPPPHVPAGRTAPEPAPLPEP
jgi:general secretion pathway protein D